VRVCIVRLCAFVYCVRASVGDGVLCECACACVRARANKNANAYAYAYACVRAGPVHCVRVYYMYVCLFVLCMQARVCIVCV